MLRLAWFAPLAPQLQSARGELVRRLRDRHTIDIYADREGSDDPVERGSQDAHDFVWQHRRAPYDLTVFELADHRAYDFVWPYLIRYPGLVILHDGGLHRSRGDSLLRQVRLEDYCAEFAFDHPDVSEHVPRLGIPRALDHARDLWPMRRVIIESSRWLVAPSTWLADEIRAEAPHERIEVVEPGLPECSFDETDRMRVRARLGLTSDDVLFVAWIRSSDGGRVAETVSAFSRLESSTARLLLPDESAAQRLPERVRTIAGLGIPDDDVDTLAAADVCLCLQWPARWDGRWRWLECLAAGRPTIGFDLADHVDLPTIDPRDGQTRRPAAAAPPPFTPDGPVGVGIDIVDESHSLKLAMRQLGTNAALREQLGRNARRLCEARYGLPRMVDDIDAAIRRAVEVPLDAVSRRGLPTHLLADGTAAGRAHLQRLRATIPWPFDEPPRVSGS